MRNIIQYKNFSWVDIMEPTREDIEYLRIKFRLHPLTLKSIIPAVHHPDLDVFRNYLYIILHYPHARENGEIQIQEFDIIASASYFITNHYERITPLSAVWEECSKSEAQKKENMERGSGFLLFTILNNLLKETLKKLDRIEKEIESVEKEIFTGKEREMVKEISYLKRKIFSFWRIIEPQQVIFEYLKNSGAKLFGQEFQHYFSALLRNHRKIENTLRVSKETIESLEETNHILVTLKMNEIIKMLTVFSAFLLPLTLLASIWGMNTSFLPFTKSSFDFWLILGLMAFTLGGMVIYFKRRKWL